LQTHVLILFAIGSAAVTGEPASPAANAIVESYCVASLAARQSLNGASMEVAIDASIPKLKKHGRLHALRRISALGRITYELLRFDGDGTVKNQVIARYLTAEAQAQSGEVPSIAVTPQNYSFKYKGRQEYDGRGVHVFQVAPRKKRVGLYKGEMWIDAATFLRVRESGIFVKSPSIFVKRIEFVRTYEIRDGIAVPLQVQSVVETRLVGKAEMTIDFSHVSLDGQKHTAADGDEL
jgi:hypothetical protein